jgi:putative addiction module killer protein
MFVAFMLQLPVIELIHYQDANGRCPFKEWIETIRDKNAKARIAVRLFQVEHENLGDSKPVGEGVMELRINVGAGYRVYCARHGQSYVVLLCGGDKGSQSKDITLAKELWADWKRRRR